MKAVRNLLVKWAIWSTAGTFVVYGIDLCPNIWRQLTGQT